MSEHDEETARLLAELEQDDNEREALENRARELGVKFHPNAGDDTLRQRIAEAEQAPVAAEAPQGEVPRTPAPKAVKPSDGGLTITNPTRMVQRVGMIVMAPGAVHQVTDREQADARTMAKVETAIRLGLVHKA